MVTTPVSKMYDTLYNYKFTGCDKKSKCCKKYKKSGKMNCKRCPKL